ncbi:MAG TPA: hypothetical protein VGD74_03535, partial [Vulgatibacter sp.]
MPRQDAPGGGESGGRGGQDADDGRGEGGREQGDEEDDEPGDGLLMATPASVSFDDSVVGLIYQSTLTLTNVGHGRATIRDFDFWATDTWSIGLRPLPLRLAPGESVEWTVAYYPLKEECTGSVQVWTESEEPLVVGLRGTATIPPIAWVAKEVDFGTVDVGEARTLSTFVRNAGTGILRVTAVSSSSDRFSIGEIQLPSE